jgi:tripartite-type tricarboxylate transporter receptor subunit TctC
MKSCALSAGALALASALSFSAHAQTYPSKPVRMIVPFPPGGGTDYTARLIGQKLSELWGQGVVIENRPGASTIIGSELVVKSPPDGYTLLMGSVNHTINPSLIPKLPYDTIKDFAPITVCVTAAYILVVHPSLPVKSVKELIALARARPGQINYSSSGSSGPQHLAGELFKMMARADITHVPYKGGGPQSRHSSVATSNCSSPRLCQHCHM